MTASLDTPDDPAVDACVVACPPHPEHGGNQSDRHLRAVADALVDGGVACIRFDYGPWDQGRGEWRDAVNAVSWARDRYGRVGLFGYSFGAIVALEAAAANTNAGTVLAPDAAARDALADVACPVQVVYGERDETVDWRPVVERARELGQDVVRLSADHHFVGQNGAVADAVVPFLADHLA